MSEQTIGSTPDPAIRPGFAVERVQAHSALLRLDGTVDPPHLVVDGEVDISTLATFTDALSDLIEHGSGDVSVDVEKLGFIDVGGLRALAAAACRLGAQRRRLVLGSVAPHLAKLMALVGWSQIPSLVLLPRTEAGTGYAYKRDLRIFRGNCHRPQGFAVLAGDRAVNAPLRTKGTL